MMKLKDFKFFIILLFFASNAYAQNSLFGVVKESKNRNTLKNVNILTTDNVFLTKTDSLGFFEIKSDLDTINIYLSKNGYNTLIKEIDFSEKSTIELEFVLSLSKSIDLNEVSIFEEKINDFSSDFLEDVDNKSIFKAKKSELILTDIKSAKSVNSSRQMYNQTPGLNIYETDDAGLQLNIGGRGLDPRRSSNFNVRQNGYEISADPLGYPESYYSPTFESLENIQIIRGAGALQYGTQFGGLVNFNIKKPVKNKTLELISRNTWASNNFYSNFTSISGTKRNISYYSFFNHKTGNGFRPNTDFNSNNFYTFFNYNISNKFKFSLEFTFLNYLAQQPGGLTDKMFEENIFQSIRHRNWFKIKWLLYNFQTTYDFTKNTSISINSFILNANRYSIGYRPRRVDNPDLFNEATQSYNVRDLIKSDFNNFSIETKLIHEDNLLFEKEVFLLGFKFYSGESLTEQGPGSTGIDPNFEFQYFQNPGYPNQSNYSNPNLNFALFNENIFYLTNKISLVPGVRFEYIKTSSNGFYRVINLDNALNIIDNRKVLSDDERERMFLLYGLGLSYNLFEWSEFYSNYSRNYRAVTFADINITSPNFVINPNIKDESGFTLDAGFRGNYRKVLFYDISTYYLFYNDRIGFVPRSFFIENSFIPVVKNEKGNIGDAKIFGQELLINLNISNIFKRMNDFKVNYFINFSNTKSEYINSEENGIQGNVVEFVPKISYKTGFNFKFKKFSSNIQYSFTSQQFTDASNAIDGDLSGVIGEIPSYKILDLSFSYNSKKINYEFGINNALNEYYFTNRATGYPGPGILPSPDRNFYFTVQFKI